MLIELQKAGTVLDLTNEVDGYKDVVYASVTAPALTRIEVRVDGEIHEVVWIGPGASHSWWTNAGGKLLSTHGLKKGSRLLITASGACAFRIDWI